MTSMATSRSGRDAAGRPRSSLARARRDRTARRLFACARIEELHVSHDDGRSDQHARFGPLTPHLAWVRERLREVPVVVESYWHRLTFDEQRRQVAFLRGGT